MKMADTLTRASLAEKMHESVGLSRSESLRLVDRVLSLIRHEIGQGEDVKLSGFGSFVIRQKSERIGRNPRTREEVPISARRVVTFRPSTALRDRVADLV